MTNTTNSKYDISTEELHFLDLGTSIRLLVNDKHKVGEGILLVVESTGEIISAIMTTKLNRLCKGKLNIYVNYNKQTK